jgi:hypothetical protein
MSSTNRCDWKAIITYPAASPEAIDATGPAAEISSSCQALARVPSYTT